jgi:ankyrin repeat protein
MKVSTGFADRFITNAGINGNLEAVQDFVANYQWLIDIKGSGGQTALLAACQYGQTAIVQFLLESGADIELKGSWGNCTPLDMAAWQGREEVVALLLMHHAKADSRSQGGRTPLMTAAGEGKARIVKLLIEADADINAKDFSGMTPLMYACRAGSINVVDMLLEKGADINAKASGGFDALYYARTYARREDICHLLQNWVQIKAERERLAKQAKLARQAADYNAALKNTLPVPSSPFKKRKAP